MTTATTRGAPTVERPSSARVLDGLSWALPLVPRDRRAAIRLLLAFRGEVQAVAESNAPKAERRSRLSSWRMELDSLEAGMPTIPLTAALEDPMRRYALSRTELENLILSADMDAAGILIAPPLCDLRLYCRRSNGALGVLILAVLGETGRPAGCFGLAAGEAIGLTILLRDLEAAARGGRLCLPREALAEAGIVIAHPTEIIGHPDLPAACDFVAALAAERFDDAEMLLAEVAPSGRPFMRAVLGAYATLLEALRDRGWQDLAPPPMPGRLGLSLKALRQKLRGAA